MKKLILLISLAIIFACKQDKRTANETTREVNQYSIEQFMNNESVRGGSFSPDNSKLLYISNKSGIYNLYSVSTQGGETIQLTASDSTSVLAASYFPNDERIIFAADNNGDELYHLFLRDTSGIVTELTPYEGARVVPYGWSHDNKGFYYGSNKRDKRFMDVYKLNIDDFTSDLLFKNDEGYQLNYISNGETYLAITKALNTNDSDLFIYSLKTKDKIKINDSLSGNSGEVITNDNKWLYYTTDAGSEFSYLMKYNLETQEKIKVSEKPWDILGCNLSHDNTYLTVYINEDGKSVIEVINIQTGEHLKLPVIENGNITNVNISRDEKIMRMYVGGSNMPSNIYTYNLNTNDLHKLTDVLNKTIDAEDMVTAKVIRYKSFDGTEIPAIYYVPHQANENNKVPAMVWVHGGPGGQSRQNYSPLIQYLVNNGYAILAVNNRGSSGYGKTFYRMDDQNHGEKDLQDCVEGKNWLSTQPEINSDKIGIIGGSYGGYMTMAALTYAPEEFDVGVNIFGVTNWMRTLKSIPPWWESFKDALYLEMGDPYSADSIRLKRISPLFHTEKVTKPLMVLQGAKDPRVLQVESDEIVSGVQKNGVPVEYVLFEDEGHGFVKKDNQIEAYSNILIFLDRYLKESTKIESHPKNVTIDEE